MLRPALVVLPRRCLHQNHQQRHQAEELPRRHQAEEHQHQQVGHQEEHQHQQVGHQEEHPHQQVGHQPGAQRPQMRAWEAFSLHSSLS